MPKIFVKEKGFTLIELLVSISIIAIIATVGLYSYNSSQTLARDAKRKQDLRSVANALELYYQQYKHYPCTNNWQFSYSLPSSWVANDYNISGCGGVSDQRAFNNSFINFLPVDPKNNANNSYLPTGGSGSDTGNNYSYGYWSGTSNPACNGKTNAGSAYILVTQLENKKDTQRLSQNPVTWCGNPLSNTVTSGSTYVITGE